MTTDPLELLARALDQCESVIRVVRTDQLDLATPCRSWNVAALLDHMLADLPRFLESARGGQPDYTAAVPDMASNWATAFHPLADELVEAWRGALDPAKPASGQAPRSFQEMQIAELVVHSWDLAAALGTTASLDPELAEYSARWMASALAPEFRGSDADGKAFGPLVTVPADASAYNRLAAVSGRDPGWAPAGH